MGLQGYGLRSGSSEELVGSIREFLILNEEVCSCCEMLYLFRRQLPLFVFILNGKGPASYTHSLGEALRRSLLGL